jgi:hypothetical protein
VEQLLQRLCGPQNLSNLMGSLQEMVNSILEGKVLPIPAYLIKRGKVPVLPVGRSSQLLTWLGVGVGWSKVFRSLRMDQALEP